MSVCKCIKHSEFGIPCMQSISEVIDFARTIRHNLCIRWAGKELLISYILLSEAAFIFFNFILLAILK